MSVPVFPTLPGITFPRQRSQAWSTVKQDAIGGKRTRVPLWTFPRYQYELPFSYLRSDPNIAEWQQLSGFIASVLGPALLWGYADPADGSVSAQEFGIGDGVSTAFQLVRTLGGFTEPVFLVSGTPAIFVAGSPVTPSSISASGVVNFPSPPASSALLTWTGNFLWPCRFDDDATDFSQFMTKLFEVKALKFSTEKL